MLPEEFPYLEAFFAALEGDEPEVVVPAKVPGRLPVVPELQRRALREVYPGPKILADRSPKRCPNFRDDPGEVAGRSLSVS